jgi:hypothetical protein
MITDLFVTSSGVAGPAIESVIPPTCRRPIDTPTTSVDGDEAIAEAPEWRPRAGARHFVPCLSLLGPATPSFRFELSALVEGRWTPWAATATVGPRDCFPALPAGGAIAVDVDTFTTAAVVRSVRLRLRIRPSAALSAPWMMTLSACDLERRSLQGSEMTAPVHTIPALSVPPRSQMEEAAAIRERICSPASVAMVLAYWGSPASVPELAAEILDPRLDRYGVWPSAIAAAARRGVAGYLLRFPDWSTAAWCLGRGMPIVASIRYEEGELQGACVPRTDGHLVVLTGVSDTHVFVNDPAAASAGDVARAYLRQELCAVWLARAGVGYVFFRPEGTPPPAPPEPVQSRACDPLAG